MPKASFKPTLYSKKGCPFSFKVMLFLLESGLIKQFNLVELDPDAENAQQIREQLETATGKPAAFPTVEVTQGDYWTESDEIIEKYAHDNDIKLESLTVFNIYRAGMYVKYTAMAKKIKMEFPDFFDQLSGRKAS